MGELLAAAPGWPGVTCANAAQKGCFYAHAKGSAEFSMSFRLAGRTCGFEASLYLQYSLGEDTLYLGAPFSFECFGFSVETHMELSWGNMFYAVDPAKASLTPRSPRFGNPAGDAMLAPPPGLTIYKVKACIRVRLPCGFNCKWKRKGWRWKLKCSVKMCSVNECLSLGPIGPFELP